ncbi:hypothetical protein H5410_031535 [Solanum commersonii]|uniref:Uncharacterized protein n=1 Tax=Solanum commersonii TaxID=4109 RepID=A0A9J5YJG5_SOLCO|nr:hypothetical protein H5410_031535 [Solanum commersonii]
MFKIQFGRNSKLRDIGTAMSNKIVVLLLIFPKEPKSLRSCTSCSYDWRGTTHLILAMLAENSLGAFTFLAALVERTCHLYFHPFLRLHERNIWTLHDYGRKFITQSRSIEITISFFHWKDDSKNYTMCKNNGQRVCGLVQISLQSQLTILPRLFSFEQLWEKIDNSA